MNPWLSLGGHFDYHDWPDRQRFIELDIAISLQPTQGHAQGAIEIPPFDCLLNIELLLLASTREAPNQAA